MRGVRPLGDVPEPTAGTYHHEEQDAGDAESQQGAPAGRSLPLEDGCQPVSEQHDAEPGQQAVVDDDGRRRGVRTLHLEELDATVEERGPGTGTGERVQRQGVLPSHTGDAEHQMSRTWQVGQRGQGQETRADHPDDLEDHHAQRRHEDPAEVDERELEQDQPEPA